MTALLQVSDLSVSFHTSRGSARAVNGVSFDIDAGETLAILGESGSGKSVTAQAIMGLLPRHSSSVDTGTVVFKGEDVLQMPRKQARQLAGRDIGMVFQDPLSSLNPVYTVGAQISEAARRRFGAGKAQAHQLAVDMLHRVGIPHPKQRVKDYPHQFSGGMRQRVMIAIALANNPELLIADEPTTALDVTVQAQIFDLLAELQAETNMAMILITHDLGVAAGVADRAVVMYNGKTVETGTIRELYDDSAHPYTAGLLRSIPNEHDPSQTLVPIPGTPPDIWDARTGCAFAPRCRFAQDICTTDQPALVPTADGSRTHHAACHFAKELQYT
ncbi:MAG: ABC transporter ATP-binding protein [Micrococcaceae bacterium]|nr:ABC transporter ATP-binding protein [Micrococcaceae bacterium]